MIREGLNIFSGNKLENLIKALSKVIELPVNNVFSDETIIIQSQGMARWISLNLALCHGIAANISYSFPNAFVYDILSRLAPYQKEQSLYEPEIMTWKIMKFISELIDEKQFITIKNYFGKNNIALKKYQLSLLIADTFDQYLLFRPEMIQAWEDGKENHWQAILWRKIVNENEELHRAGLLNHFKKIISQNEVQKDFFPERISVFGISSLPMFHMEIFNLLSNYMQVNLFLLNPCCEYWGNIVSANESKKLKDKTRQNLNHTDDCNIREKDDCDIHNLYMDKGNSLLASMGGLGREFFDIINDFDHEEYTLFEDPGDDNLLSSIQSDIYMFSNNLHDRDLQERKRVIDLNDKSIEVHSAHSAMREVEILQDSIYNMFELDDELMPRDIIVMTPDIEAFSPLIKSVFDRVPDSKSRLPYSIADRSVKNESRIAETFIGLLDLAESRFAVSDLMNVLENKSVQKRFGIIEQDLETISLWVNDTKIRWGIDGKHRSKLGMPDFEENSWIAGLKKMLLGYAMPGDGETLYRSILPYNNIEGENAELLGNFCEFADKLFKFAKDLTKNRSAKLWKCLLLDSLEDFFINNDNTQKELQIIRDELNKLVVATELVEYKDEIDLSVIRHYLSKKLDSKEHGHGFINGGITFCAMLPMRSIPFKVICLIGMNSDTYPRQTRAAGFDLIAKNPMRGDRSRRKDDRYLFLEVLISARNKLYISYTGQSIKDNSSVQPSVLVSEVVDYINEEYPASFNEAESFKITKHPLQAFNYNYFNRSNTDLFSYSEENFRAAKASLNTDKEVTGFITKRLPEPEKEHYEIEINDLCLFYRNPSKYLLEKRLGIFLNLKSLIINEDEPFEIDWLERYQFTNDIAEKIIHGKKSTDYYEIIRASGVLPYGRTGKNDFQIMENEVLAFSGEMEKHLSEKTKTFAEINISIDGVSVKGLVDGIYDNRLIQYRYAAIKGKDILDFWIKYLVLNFAGQKNGLQYDGLIAGFEKSKSGKIWTGYSFHPVSSPQKDLETLISFYLSGICLPLEFFSESSLKFAEEVLKKGLSYDDALKKAGAVWAGNSYTGMGEGTDPNYELCFRQKDPMSELFMENSLAIFEPILANMEKIS